MTLTFTTQRDMLDRSADKPAVRLRMALRHETREAHQALDDLMSTFVLDDPTDYARFLTVHDMVLPAAERALEESGIARDLPDWPRRRRRAALHDDLAELSDRPQRPALQPSFDLSSQAARLGAAYVLEGSRMGARMLVDKVPEGDSRLPTRFLRHGEGERLWPGFIQMLDTADGAGLQQERAIAEAEHMFDSYRRAAEALLKAESLKTVL